MVEHEKTRPIALSFTRPTCEAAETRIFAKDVTAKDQLIRHPLPIMPNIAEALSCSGDKQSKQFLPCARTACGKFRSRIYIAYDQKYLTLEKLRLHHTEAETHQPNARRWRKMPAQIEHERNQIHRHTTKKTFIQPPGLNLLHMWSANRDLGNPWRRI